MNYIQNNIQKQESSLERYYEALKTNKVFGWTCGLKGVDNLVGRLKKGKLWVVGGYTGTGKSFTLLNMLDGIIRECQYYKGQEDRYTIPKIVVFSTELTTEDYMTRHIFMRMGTFKLNLENSRDPYVIEEFKTVKDEYFKERYFNPYLPLIIGEIKSYEDIENHLSNFDFTPDIVIVDYIQDLTVKLGSRILIEEKETMPVLAAKFANLARQTGISFVYFSQVNNYTVSLDTKTSKLQPFSNGKQLAETADVTLVLSRRKHEGESSPILEIDVFKARDGRSGRVGCLIQSGFQLKELSKEESEYKLNKFLGRIDE